MHNPKTILAIDQMPGIFRIESITALPAADGSKTEYRAILYHDKIRITVSFCRFQPDIRLKANLLVSVRWRLPLNFIGGAIQISRLVLLEHPIKGFNLFETIPPTWVEDRDLVRRAQIIMDVLPGDMQHLITAVLWNGIRFYHFCDRPASVSDHHAYQNGNLRHTVEVAETVILLAEKYQLANLGISLAAAILHDVGKADEYNHWSNGDWVMTDRGKLVGHRHTVIEWIAQAMVTNRIMMPEKHYLSLMHALTAAPNAERLGIRNPSTPEATILSMADRLSGENALTAQLAKQNGGWSSMHPHRKWKYFTIPQELKPQKTKGEKL